MNPSTHLHRICSNQRYSFIQQSPNCSSNLPTIPHIAIHGELFTSPDRRRAPVPVLSTLPTWIWCRIGVVVWILARLSSRKWRIGRCVLWTWFEFWCIVIPLRVTEAAWCVESAGDAIATRFVPSASYAIVGKHVVGIVMFLRSIDGVMMFESLSFGKSWFFYVVYFYLSILNHSAVLVHSMRRLWSWRGVEVIKTQSGRFLGSNSKRSIEMASQFQYFPIITGDILLISDQSLSKNKCLLQ